MERCLCFLRAASVRTGTPKLKASLFVENPVHGLNPDVQQSVSILVYLRLFHGEYEKFVEYPVKASKTHVETMSGAFYLAGELS
jgi:hypothetical protein